MSYSIFWDYTTAPWAPEVPVNILVREIERRLYPKTVPTRSVSLFYMNRPYPQEIDGAFVEQLRWARFQIKRSALERQDPCAGKEISEILLRDIRPNDQMDLVLFCGDRQFGETTGDCSDIYLFGLSFANFHLIYNQSI